MNDLTEKLKELLMRIGVVLESTIDCIINSLIDSTVEKFGGAK